jgi:hypothetical protein
MSPDTVPIVVNAHVVRYSPHRKGSRSKEAVADLSRQQDEWYSGFPFQPPEATPLPHVLLLHMFYHLSVIFVHRSFYRSGVPASTNKCDQASNSILHLLRVSEHVPSRSRLTLAHSYLTTHMESDTLTTISVSRRWCLLALIPSQCHLRRSNYLPAARHRCLQRCGNESRHPKFSRMREFHPTLRGHAH